MKHVLAVADFKAGNFFRHDRRLTRKVSDFLDGIQPSNRGKACSTCLFKLVFVRTLALGLTAARGQGLNKLQVEIALARQDLKGVTSTSIVDVICDERKRASVAAAASHDGIQVSADFVVALGVQWCF
jgi:hypothetical protein